VVQPVSSAESWLRIPAGLYEFLDAETILRDRGCTPPQIGRLSGELGRDLLLVARGESHEPDTIDAHFGPEMRQVRQYSRVADAKLIDDVVESFRKRPVWRHVMENDPTTRQRQQLLAEEGRGRKRRRS